MIKDTRVQIRENCTSCNNGVVESPDWMHYWGIWDKHRKTFLQQQTDENWSSSRINYEFDNWEKENPYPEEPEEIPCGECEGNRVIVRWIPASEFKLLLDESS